MSPLIANFLTQAQIELLGYIDTDSANDLINDALTGYAQSGDIRTDAEINNLITTMLLGYAQSSDIRTDAEITTIATNTISPLIANFLSQSEIEALGYQTAAEVSAIVSPLIANFLTQAQIQALGYIDTDTANALITASLAGYAQSSDIRTDNEINALITAMLSGYARTADLRTDAQVATIATNTITPLIANFLSQSEIEALGYQTEAEVAALITPRIANFLTQAQIEALGYVDTATANALITAALAGYAQTDDIRTDAEINTLITAMLSGYARTSDIRTDAEITTIATSTITPLIADFLSQSEIEALGYQTADQVSALITPRISSFLTQAQIEALGYLDTETASTLITEALVDYAQSGDIRTDNEINALITAMLNGYAKLSDLRTDTELANFIDSLGIESNTQLTTKVIRQENLTRYAAAVFGQSINAEAGVVLGTANFVDISADNPTDLETEWAFSTNTFGKIDKSDFNNKCNELLTANPTVSHIEVQAPSFNVQSHRFPNTNTFSATPTSPNAILGYATGQDAFEWAYVGANGLPWLANPSDTTVEYRALIYGSEGGDALKKLHVLLFALFDSPLAHIQGGDENTYPGYQIGRNTFDARVQPDIPSSDTDSSNIETSGERILYMKIDDVIAGGSNINWEIGFDEELRWASENEFGGQTWGNTHINFRQAAIGFVLESHDFEDADNNVFRDIIKPRNSDGLYNAIAEPKRILTDSDRADLSDYISNRLRLVSEGTVDPTNTMAVSGSNQVYIQHDSNNKLVSIWTSESTESGWTEFVVPTPTERFILISEGQTFPTASTENTDKILIDRRGDIPTLYANRVTDVEATEETWQFGEIDTTQFPDFLGSHAIYSSAATTGQYFYGTNHQQWFQNDGMSFVAVEPTTLFTGTNHYVSSYDTEAAAIAALPSDYTETDTYIFVINNEPQQLRSYAPAVPAHTTYNWEQINTLPSERQGVQLLNEQEVGIQTNQLHSVPNLNASVMRNFERFYCTIRVNNTQIAGFAFSYDAWAALTTQNEQADISTANGSLQVGIMRVNSTNNIHIGKQSNTERSFMIAIRGLTGTSLTSPATCHVSVWGYKH